MTSHPRDEEFLDFVSVQRHIFQNYNTEKRRVERDLESERGEWGTSEKRGRDAWYRRMDHTSQRFPHVFTQ